MKTTKNEQNARYYERCREKCRAHMRKHRVSLKGRFGRYRDGARVRGIEFSLTLEQFATFWQKACSYCGESIKTIGLDRLDNARGYCADNVVACCYFCNRMKMDLTYSAFIARCRVIVDRAEKHLLFGDLL